MRRPLATSFACASACALCAAVAWSQPSAPAAVPLDLAWSAPPSCPTRQGVLDDVARMVRTSRGNTVVARVTTVERTGPEGTATYVMDLSIDQGSRRLEGDRCDVLARAAAFILALAIDPDAKPLPTGTSTAGTEPPPTPTQSPAAAPTTSAPPPTPEPPKQVERPIEAPPAETPTGTSQSTEAPPPGRLVMAAEAALDLDVLPKPALGPLVSIGVRLAPLPLRVEAFGALFFEQTTGLAIPGANIGAHVSGLVGGARAALPIELGDGVEAGPAAGFIVHALRASAFGATNSAEGSAQWFGLLLGGHVAWKLHTNFALRADVHADIALARPEFVIDNAGSVHRPPTLSGCAAVGPELRFF